MMLSKLALIAGVFAASTAGGVALGGFTIGGFRIDQPTDTLESFLTDRSAPGAVASYAAAGPVLLPHGEPIHVCTGCDAKLYRDDPGRYDPSDYAEPGASEQYRGYGDQPARQDYADDESWDAVVTAYYDNAGDKAVAQPEPDDAQPVALASIM